MICLDMRGRGAVLSIIGKKYGPQTSRRAGLTDALHVASGDCVSRKC